MHNVQPLTPNAAKSRYHRRYREAEWFEGKKCLFFTYSYTFLRGNKRFILAVVRGSKIYFANLGWCADPAATLTTTRMCEVTTQRVNYVWILRRTEQTAYGRTPVSWCWNSEVGVIRVSDIIGLDHGVCNISIRISSQMQFLLYFLYF